MAGRSFVVILPLVALLFAATDSFAQWREGGRRTIRRESEDERYSYCRTYTRGRIELRKRLSKAPCIEYETWGAERDGSGVWVRHGCRAEFAVREHHWDQDDDDRRGGRTIRCKSNDWSCNHCPVRNARRARIVRKLSDASCVKGSSWGVDRYGIWVDNGCEAEFEVRR